jgi:hypothetical protein
VPDSNGKNQLCAEVFSNVEVEISTLGVGTEQCLESAHRNIEIFVDVAGVKAQLQEALSGGIAHPGQGGRIYR